MINTTKEARNYFNQSGLNYTMIREDSIQVLYMMLVKRVKQLSKETWETSDGFLEVSRKIDIKKNTNRAIKECYLYLNSHYFTRREAISFNKDGFIGFAGWSDLRNLKFIIDAFIEWCDWMKEVKNDEPL